MKADLKSIILGFTILLLFHLSSIMTAHGSETQFNSALQVNCKTALSMDCLSHTTFASDFVIVGDNALLDDQSCVENEGSGSVKEFWLSVNLWGSTNYYLDGYGVNKGMEIYTGSCDSLIRVDCVSATGDDTFIAFYPPVAAHYYIRLLGHETMGKADFTVSLNCELPQTACSISVDSLEVGTCVSDSGTVTVFMSGAITPESEIPLIFAEVMTDMGYFMFSGESVGGVWEASFEVSGSVVNFVSVFSGNSANGCSDGRTGFDLPTMSCDSMTLTDFTGLVEWNANCGSGVGEVAFYEPGTDILVETHPTLVLSTGLFQINNPPLGVFDVLLKVDGFLPKGFSGVEIPLIVSPYACGVIKRGDVNNDGVINILDLSAILPWFNKVLPDDNSLSYLDQNCDGVIDVIDLTSIVAGMSSVGDTVPLD